MTIIEDILKEIQEQLQNKAIQFDMYPNIENLSMMYPNDVDYIPKFKEEEQRIKDAGRLLHVTNPKSFYETNQVTDISSSDQQSKFINKIAVSVEDMQAMDYAYYNHKTYKPFTLQPNEDSEKPVTEPTDFYEETSLFRSPYKLKIRIRYICRKQFQSNMEFIINKTLSPRGTILVNETPYEIELIGAVNGIVKLESMMDTVHYIREYYIHDVKLVPDEVTNKYVDVLEEIEQTHEGVTYEGVKATTLTKSTLVEQ